MKRGIKSGNKMASGISIGIALGAYAFDASFPLGSFYRYRFSGIDSSSPLLAA
ncbi:hypothetical protein MNQ98_23390 [Paenibacillus sp. N3/727]|uniref:hypothetical protein n=1 Tax=Paenibacillus sp. N3/727 TaxID=2925845 RepID=UPI001F52E368|nr:hypothetical protein [Paenibacillus sp. N3/727]UNK17392.1 hypothetical protein MNQ98_23390 [Paenibacillus sp. N3/727]